MTTPTAGDDDVDPTDDDALAEVAEDLPGRFDFEHGGWWHPLTAADPDAADDLAALETVLLVEAHPHTDDMVLSVRQAGAEGDPLLDTMAPRLFWETGQNRRTAANALGGDEHDDLKAALLGAFHNLAGGIVACDAPFWRVWRSGTGAALTDRIRSVDFYPDGEDSECRVTMDPPADLVNIGTQTFTLAPTELMNGPPEVLTDVLAQRFFENVDLGRDDWEHVRSVLEHEAVLHGVEGDAEEDTAIEALVGKLSTTRVTDDLDEIHPRNDDTLLFEANREVPEASPIDDDTADVVWMLGEPFVEWRREQGYEQQCTRRVLEERGLKVGEVEQKVLTTTDATEHRKQMWPILACEVGITREDVADDASADDPTTVTATDVGEAFPR